MIDDDTLSDVDLVARIAAYDVELAQRVRARLCRLRLARVITATPPAPAVWALARRLLRRGRPPSA
jgi:hypothetical protein